MIRRLTPTLVAIAVLAIAGGLLAWRGRAPAAHRRSTAPVTSLPPTSRARAATSTTHAPTTIVTTTIVTTTATIPPTTTNTSAPTPAPIAPPAPTMGTVGSTAAPATGGSLASLRGRTITIDPGHNGGNSSHTSEISRLIFIGTQTRACDTTGTETNDGYTEAAYNLDVALRLRSVLQSAGANVVMTRETNDGWGPCIDQRAAIGNSAHSDAAISIHADGGPAGGRGFHVLMPALVTGYTDDIYASSHRLGVDVRDAFTATGMPTSTYYASQGLAERTDLGGLNLSNVPKVFIETGNMRNSTDASLLENSDFRQREAQDLAVGLDQFLAGR